MCALAFRLLANTRRGAAELGARISSVVFGGRYRMVPYLARMSKPFKTQNSTVSFPF